MLNIRIVTAGAIFSAFSLISGLAVSDAEAQTAPAVTAGKPVQLLPPTKAKTKPQAKLAAKPVGRTRTASRSRMRPHSIVADRKRPHAPAQIAQAPALPGGALPAAPTAALTEISTAMPTPPQPAAPPAELAPSELVVGGHTVLVASPDDANEIDLAANEAGAQPSVAPRDRAAASPPPLSDITEAQPKSDSARAATAQQRGSEVGSTSWILQVLAAFGGAVAAGSVAWFLIGAAPQRTYG